MRLKCSPLVVLFVTLQKVVLTWVSTNHSISAQTRTTVIRELESLALVFLGTLLRSSRVECAETKGPEVWVVYYSIYVWIAAFLNLHILSFKTFFYLSHNIFHLC